MFVTLHAQSVDTPAVHRPGDGGPPTQVRTVIYVADLREIDGARQSFTADVLVRLQWRDERLAGGKALRRIATTAAWNPGIQIVNRIAVQSTLPETLEVDQNGDVSYRQRFIGQFSAMLDLSEFPFDRQNIFVRIVAPDALPNEIQFVPDKENGFASRLSITDWKIESSKANNEPFQIAPGGKSFAGFLFQLNASRHFHYFLVQIIIPLSLVLGMSWVVFWLNPLETGPLISIAITSMLTIVAYRYVLGNFLPRLPFLTRMDYFIFGCTDLVFLALVNVVFISRLIMTNRELLARKLDFHARWFFPLLYLLILSFAFFR